MISPESDSKALRLARVITQIYEQDAIGGNGQRQAKVQALLADEMESHRRSLNSAMQSERELISQRDNWRARYQEITGEAE